MSKVAKHEDYFCLGDNKFLTFLPDQGIKFEDLTNLGTFGGAYYGDRKNFILEYSAGEITITYDYYYLDPEDGGNEANQVVTIRDGVATSEGDYIYTEEAMVDKMLNSILNANKKINLDALSQDCKMKVLHKFFKAANKPEMSVLINNVVAQYL